MNLVVSEEFVRKAHKAACPEWQVLIEAEFPSLFPDLIAKVKETQEYKDYRRFSTSNADIRRNGKKIVIDLPNANTEWTVSAWKLAMKVMEIDNKFYPRHEDGYTHHLLLVKN